jgi:site-specific DNA-methyltransferase (adenine-specific)
MWVFGSMRYFLNHGVPPGWRYAQDIVWEKANGTGIFKDRFRRIHEHAVQFYRADAPWAGVYRDIQRLQHLGPRKNVKRRISGAGDHLGGRGEYAGYVDDGTRLPPSVIWARSVRGGAHKTAKPVELLEVLVKTSCPPGGLVGDFFAGGGSAGEAAMLAGRDYIGCELQPSMALVAEHRLRGILHFGGANPVRIEAGHE